MILVLLAVFAVVFIISCHMLNRNYEPAELWLGVVFASIIGLCIFVIVTIALFVKVTDGRLLQAKIDMYEAENQKIEQDISNLVNQYMAHEGDVVDKVSNESSLTLVNLYPDLKSSDLVKQEIEIHTKNSAKIKKLKEQQIDTRNYKLWLYFGGM